MSDTKTPAYIKNLLKPNGSKPAGRKVWSIDLESTWLPFFTATNAMHETAIAQEALGSPLRLAYNQDGSVKFSKSGKPVVKVAKDISDSVRLVRENFVAGLQTYANDTLKNHGEEYKAEVQRCIEAGQPIKEHDKQKLDEAMDRLIKAAIEQADVKERQDKQLVTT